MAEKQAKRGRGQPKQFERPKQLSLTLEEEDRAAYLAWCSEHGTTPSKDLREHIQSRITGG